MNKEELKLRIAQMELKLNSIESEIEEIREMIKNIINYLFDE